MEPAISAMLDRKRERIAAVCYSIMDEAIVGARLPRAIAEFRPGGELVSVHRLGGGASKEQFDFALLLPSGERERFVLRMDPLQTATESDRQREFELNVLGKVHDFNHAAADLPHFAAPESKSIQAAPWQLNWWARVWQDDSVVPEPLMAAAELWMRGNLPCCAAPGLVHGDLRPGNFLFDEATGRITAVLDWELARIGDYHEDLAWLMMSLISFSYGGAHHDSGVYAPASWSQCMNIGQVGKWIRQRCGSTGFSQLTIAWRYVRLQRQGCALWAQPPGRAAYLASCAGAALPK